MAGGGGVSEPVVRVRLFAALRERFGTDGLELCVRGTDRAALSAALDAALGAGSGPALFAPPNRVARNRELVEADELVLAAGDEIAFLPPVTGG
jgi:molybdopterin converting factor small subunit